MLSLSKHLYRCSKLITYTVEMLRQAQHDGPFSFCYVCAANLLINN